jgi:ribosomal protein S18 acetylase RimI-like enzyme
LPALDEAHGGPGHRSTILDYERLGLVVWPAAETLEFDGWILCFSRGTTRRTNSVQTLSDGAGSLDLEARISRCEVLSRQRRQPSIFKLTEVSRPPGLDRVLERRGYRKEDPTSVQILDPIGADFQESREVRLEPRPSAEWFEACVRLNRVAGADREGLRAILDRIAEPCCFASISEAGEICAEAVGVLGDRRLFLCEVAVAPEQRRRGLARVAVETLLAWGRERGAGRAWLQVVVENRSAQRFYQQLGFRELYRYWYRSRR